MVDAELAARNRRRIIIIASAALLASIGAILLIVWMGRRYRSRGEDTHPGDAVGDVPTPTLTLPQGDRLDLYNDRLWAGPPERDGLGAPDAPDGAARAQGLDSLRRSFYREVERQHQGAGYDSLYAQLEAITARGGGAAAREDSARRAADSLYLARALQLSARYTAPPAPAHSPGDSLAAARAEPTPIPREPVSKTAPRPPRLQPDSAARIPPDSTARCDSVAPPRRAGFYGFTGQSPPVASNSTRAVVDQTVTISPGEYVRLRLLEPLPFRGVTLPAGSVVVAQGSLQGNRMRLYVERLERDGYIFSAALSAFDLDGLEGIFVPGSAAADAARETAAQLGQQSTTGFTFSQRAKDAVATELASTAIQGVSKYLGGRIRAVRLRLKAGHRVYLVPRGPGE